MVVVLLENWVWEQMTLASGLVGIDDQAFQVILINLLNLNYMIGSGMQSSASTVVGNQIGYGNVGKAIEYFKVSVITGQVLFCAQTIFFYLYLENIIGLFTNIPEMLENIPNIKLIFCLNIIPDCMAGLLRGAIKALAIQD